MERIHLADQENKDAEMKLVGKTVWTGSETLHLTMFCVYLFCGFGVVVELAVLMCCILYFVKHV